jgi:type I restriction enzyme S subunit
VKTVPLGEVADFINGFAFKPEDWHDGGLPIIRIQNLTDPSKPINLTTRQVPEKYKVRRGDILVSWSATLGVFTWDRTDEALVNQHIFRVLPHESVIAHGYLKHILDGALVSMEQHLHGATMKHVNRGEFLATRIPLPPLDEQRRIAAILDQADGLRTARNRSAGVADELTSALFLDMFGDPVANRAAWPRVPLGELVSGVTSGTSPVCESRPARDGEWAVLKLGAVSYGRFNHSENKAFLGDLNSLRRVEVRSGDFLFSRKNTKELVGATVVVEETPPRLLLPDLIFRLGLQPDRLDPLYLHHLLRSKRKRPQVVALASGSASSMANISQGRLLGLQVELPPIDLQRTYAERLRGVGRLDRRFVRSRTELDTLFTSLQSRAFSGKL